MVGTRGKLQYCVHPPADPKFHKLLTFGHISELQALHVSFHQLKHCSVKHFFHRCECFLISPRGIYVPRNVGCVQASFLHRTHFAPLVYGRWASFTLKLALETSYVLLSSCINAQRQGLTIQWLKMVATRVETGSTF